MKTRSKDSKIHSEKVTSSSIVKPKAIRSINRRRTDNKTSTESDKPCSSHASSAVMTRHRASTFSMKVPVQSMSIMEKVGMRKMMINHIDTTPYFHKEALKNAKEKEHEIDLMEIPKPEDHPIVEAEIVSTQLSVPTTTKTIARIVSPKSEPRQRKKVSLSLTTKLFIQVSANVYQLCPNSCSLLCIRQTTWSINHSCHHVCITYNMKN